MKKTTTQRVLVILGLTALLASTVLVTAGFGQAGRGGGPFERGCNPRMLKELELTDEQQDAIKDKKFELDKKKTKLQADVKIAQMELERIMDDESPDLDAALAKVEEIGEKRTDMHKLSVEGRIFFKDQLTPEQLEKWEEMKAKYQRARQARRGQQGRGRGAQMRRHPGMGMGQGTGPGMGMGQGMGMGPGTGPGMTPPGKRGQEGRQQRRGQGSEGRRMHGQQGGPGAAEMDADVPPPPDED